LRGSFRFSFRWSFDWQQQSVGLLERTLGMNAVPRIGRQTTNGTKIPRELTKDWIRLQDVHIAPNFKMCCAHWLSDFIIATCDSSKFALPGHFRDVGQVEIQVTRSEVALVQVG
jgi:hypothetical protein